MSLSFNRHPSSYRDPSGFVFYRNGILYRQINKISRKNFDLFINSGLYKHLSEKGILVTHQTISENLTGTDDWYLTIQPETIPFISYSYEWCFEMLKDAAHLTLRTAKEAMEFGMMLRDASAYNIQLHKGKMIFIDTLSFEEYDETQPWIAYRQFCEQFLAPLALMHYLKTPLQNLLIAYPDGIPLKIASAMLPFKSKLNLNSYLHLHLQGLMHKKKNATRTSMTAFSKKKMLDLLRSLEESIRSLSFSKLPTTWSNYYEEAEQRGDYLASKKQIINEWIGKLNFKSAFDAGANKGEFSELLANKSGYVISSDLDHSSVNKLYENIKQKNIANICPLIVDLANPSPALGVNNEERDSFLKRINVDLTLALALIHHLALGRNIPFDKIAQMFVSITRYLLIEFVPASDEKVLLVAENKKELIPGYSEEIFVNNFKKYFSILEKREISNSGRTLYLMEKLNS